MESTPRRHDDKPWTFLTNHARVLIVIARDPDVRVRDVAQDIGITERAAQLIITDLEAAGYLTRTRVGRRNRYTVNAGRPFRHPTEADHDVQALIGLFTGRGESRAPAAHAPAESR
ncbi:helix-turn-helix transcriptional regulator [Spirillospora sp. CA-108201]